MSALSYWSPLILILSFLILALVALVFRNRGEKGYKKGSGQTKVFLAGEEEPEAEQRHIKAHNMYWGFFQALKRYYDPTIRAHTGIINDYILWFVTLIAVAGVIVFLTDLI
jgi:hypothetical protein